MRRDNQHRPCLRANGEYPQLSSSSSLFWHSRHSDPALLALLGHLYAVSGQKVAAQESFRSCSRSAPKDTSHLYVALIYTGLGDKDQAFAWLDKAFAERCEYLVYLPTNRRQIRCGTIPGFPRCWNAWVEEMTA